jgi:cytoskeletal protein RodZ
MDEELVETEGSTVGQRLRAAREEKGLNLEDIAAQTRIPRRHLESLEEGHWDKLPAPTYTIGFARSYATALGLDRTEIADQLRGEMGGQRAPVMAPAEVFEPTDPARTMPKWLVLGAIVAVIAIVLVMSWLNERSLDAGDEAGTSAPPAVAAAPQAAPAPQPAQPAAAQGPVVLTATAPAWIRVTDGGKSLYEGVLQPGQSFTVPPTATAPLLRAGAPEALRINVGNAVAPAVGPAGKVTSNVSLKPADLMRGPSPTAPAAPRTAG